MVYSGVTLGLLGFLWVCYRLSMNAVGFAKGLLGELFQDYWVLLGVSYGFTTGSVRFTEGLLGEALQSYWALLHV